MHGAPHHSFYPPSRPPLNVSFLLCVWWMMFESSTFETDRLPLCKPKVVCVHEQPNRARGRRNDTGKDGTYRFLSLVQTVTKRDRRMIATAQSGIARGDVFMNETAVCFTSDEWKRNKNCPQSTRERLTFIPSTCLAVRPSPVLPCARFSASSASPPVHSSFAPPYSLSFPLSVFRTDSASIPHAVVVTLVVELKIK